MTEQENAKAEPQEIETTPPQTAEPQDETKSDDKDSKAASESGSELNGKDDTEQSEVDTSSQDEDEDTTTKAKRRERYSKRVEQLVAQRTQWQRRAEDAEQQLKRYAEKQTPPSEDASQEEIDRYNLRQVMREERANEIASEQEAVTKASRTVRRQIFEAKLEQAADKMPDVAQKFAAVDVSEHAADFIAESQKAPELANYLGSNPHKAREIYDMPAIRQVAELARLEARLSAAPQARQATQAPKPVSTLKGGNAHAQKRKEDMSMAEYTAWRNKQNGKA